MYRPHGPFVLAKVAKMATAILIYIRHFITAVDYFSRHIEIFPDTLDLPRFLPNSKNDDVFISQSLQIIRFGRASSERYFG